MQNKLFIYNSLSKEKELFIPLHAPFVGMYVCGPTVYSDAHLGHARPAITFDLLFRYLTHLKYKVRYVRNITDVGHLENDADEGEDKIEKKARFEHLEPMEVVQKYMNTFYKNMEQLNTLHPSIEPRASGHIIEQQELIKFLIKKDFAYEINGSIGVKRARPSSSCKALPILPLGHARLSDEPPPRLSVGEVVGPQGEFPPLG